MQAKEISKKAINDKIYHIKQFFSSNNCVLALDLIKNTPNGSIICISLIQNCGNFLEHLIDF